MGCFAECVFESFFKSSPCELCLFDDIINLNSFAGMGQDIVCGYRYVIVLDSKRIGRLTSRDTQWRQESIETFYLLPDMIASSCSAAAYPAPFESRTILESGGVVSWHSNGSSSTPRIAIDSGTRREAWAHKSIKRRASES